MLILTRRPGERIIIGNDIYIDILDHYRGQVRIGITAPRQIEVHRQEIYDKILEEKYAQNNQK